MTKPEVLLSTASGSSPVGSAAMLTTSVVSARAVPNARHAAQARPRMGRMTVPPMLWRGPHILQAVQPIGQQRKARHLLRQPGDVARRPQVDDRQVLAH